jgi:hypothetical protein
VPATTPSEVRVVQPGRERADTVEADGAPHAASAMSATAIPAILIRRNMVISSCLAASSQRQGSAPADHRGE